MLRRFWNWLTKKSGVVYPFRPMVDAMKAKDPELYKVVGPMPIYQGALKWREKYPEDFPELVEEAR